MDGIVLVVLYGIQTLVPWWNEMTLLFIFMMMGGITIIYFNGKLKKITND
jgi:hypothetical protein